MMWRKKVRSDGIATTKIGTCILNDDCNCVRRETITTIQRAGKSCKTIYYQMVFWCFLVWNELFFCRFLKTCSGYQPLNNLLCSDIGFRNQMNIKHWNQFFCCFLFVLLSTAADPDKRICLIIDLWFCIASYFNGYRSWTVEFCFDNALNFDTGHASRQLYSIACQCMLVFQIETQMDWVKKYITFDVDFSFICKHCSYKYFCIHGNTMCINSCFQTYRIMLDGMTMGLDFESQTKIDRIWPNSSDVIDTTPRYWFSPFANANTVHL